MFNADVLSAKDVLSGNISHFPK